MKYFLIILSITFTVVSCDVPVTIQTDQVDSKLVIEAQVTNQPDMQYVTVSRTVDFYADGISPAVSGAMISVSDDQDNTFDYSETALAGVYLPDIPFVGQVGATYTLTIDVEGETYTSTETMLPLLGIDSLTYEPTSEEVNSPNDFYDVLMYAKEPQDEENFYFFKFYKNGFEQNENGEDITVTNDIGVGEDIEGISAPYIYEVADTVTVEMYSLTRNGFIYWSDVANLIFSDGGVFAPLPANPRSNISGEVLGVFQVSALSRETIIIE